MVNACIIYQAANPGDRRRFRNPSKFRQKLVGLLKGYSRPCKRVERQSEAAATVGLCDGGCHQLVPIDGYNCKFEPNQGNCIVCGVSKRHRTF